MFLLFLLLVKSAVFTRKQPVRETEQSGISLQYKNKRLSPSADLSENV